MITNAVEASTVAAATIVVTPNPVRRAIGRRRPV
jgi:hypothetical protein